MIDKKNALFLRKSPWVQCPPIKEVDILIANIRVPTFQRGSTLARNRLDYLENLYREWVKNIIDLNDFKHCYFVNGITDAINQWVATEARPWQYLEGDYEYANMISDKGTKVTKVNNTDVLYISNPACATGNIIKTPDVDNPVILDCAYVGSTKKQKIDVPKNTEQIWFSFSKGWGLVGQRAGLVFTKEPHKSLSIMKNVEAWNYTTVEIAIAIVENFEIDTVYNMYREKQLKVCRENNFSPSDCFFIANTTHEDYIARRRISNIARLNLYNLLREL